MSALVEYSLREDTRPLPAGRPLCRCLALGQSLGNWSYRVGFALRVAIVGGDDYWINFWQAQRTYMQSSEELCVRCYEDGWRFAENYRKATRL